MIRSERFTTSLLVLAALAQARPRAMTSAALAERAGAHPVVVRRLLARLSSAGLAATQAGREGGARLALAPKRISLRAVFEAVEQGSLLPPPRDGAAKGVAPAAERACRKAERAFLKALEEETLKDVLRRAETLAA